MAPPAADTHMAAVYVGVGSNHQRREMLRFAAQQCRAQFGSLRIAPVYESPSRNGGAPYLNTVFGFDSTATPEQLHQQLRSIEAGAGRTRGGPACALDLDLLLVGDIVREESPQLPRADILRDAFVLRPLAELAPDLIHPQLEQPVIALWEHWLAGNPRGGDLISVALLPA